MGAETWKRSRGSGSGSGGREGGSAFKGPGEYSGHVSESSDDGKEMIQGRGPVPVMWVIADRSRSSRYVDGKRRQRCA